MQQQKLGQGCCKGGSYEVCFYIVCDRFDKTQIISTFSSGGRAFMILYQKTPRPWISSIAAVTLLFWVAAMSFCSVHCAGMVGHADSGKGSCHGAAVALAQHDHSNHSTEPGHQGSAPTATCLILKSALFSSNTPVYIQPDLPLLYLLAPIAFDATLSEPSTLVLRQANAREWVFTPEVCLGPAFPSLGPPFLI